MADRDDTVTASHADVGGAATQPPLSGAGPYRCLSRLGSGGMGEVFRARDEVLRRDVAVKRLTSDRAADAVARIRMLREARAQAAVAHPNLCTIYQAGEDAAGVWIAMELLPGPTLAEIGRAGPVAERRLVPYALGIARALAAAHAAGLVHRDLKPGNVMLDAGGQPKLLDFGLAKVVAPLAGGHSVAEHTGEGAVMGTPRYMSPEQAKGASVDARSDVFSLGVLLYELRAGMPPFGGETPIEVIAAIVRDDAPPLAVKVPEVSPAFAEIVHACLARDPAARPTAAELADRLERMAAGISATAPVAAFSRAGRRRRIAIVAAAVAVIAAVALAAVLLRRESGGPRERAIELQLDANAGVLAVAPGGRVFAAGPDQSLWMDDGGARRRIEIGLVAGVWCCARDRVLVVVEGDPAVLELDPVTLAITPAPDYLRGARDATGWEPSPDGTRVVVTTGREVVVRTVDGSSPPISLATAAAGERLLGGSWSPDGERVTFVRNVDRDFVVDVVAAEGGPSLATISVRSDGDLGRWPTGPVWIAPRSFLVSDMRLEGSELIRVDLERDGGERARRTVRHDPGRTLEAMSYRDGNLAMVEHGSARTVELGELLPDGRLGPLTRIGGDTDRWLAGWTADGRLVFGRSHGAQVDIVVQPPGGMATTLLGATPGHRATPLSVSDTLGVVYIDAHGDRSSLMRTDLVGTSSKVIDLDPGDQVRCGTTVCVRFRQTDAATTAQVLELATGRELETFAVHGATSFPAVSPDESRIGYGAGNTLVIRDRQTGLEEKLVVAGAAYLQFVIFSPDRTSTTRPTCPTRRERSPSSGSGPPDGSRCCRAPVPGIPIPGSAPMARGWRWRGSR